MSEVTPTLAVRSHLNFFVDYYRLPTSVDTPRTHSDNPHDDKTLPPPFVRAVDRSVHASRERHTARVMMIAFIITLVRLRRLFESEFAIDCSLA